MLVRTVLAASIAVTVLGAGTVSAQQYPSKPVRIVVGFSAGGLADQIGRLFGDYIRRSTGQSGLVDNRGGVAGTIGMDQVAKAAPDGHTLGIVIAGQLIINPHVQKNIPLDVLKDLIPVASMVNAPQIIAMSTTVPAKNAREFIALAKAKPNTFNYGSAGRGSFPHLSAAEFARAAGIQMVHVPYKGNAPAIADLLAGRVQIVSSSIGSLRVGIQAGKVRILVAATKERLPYLPDLPAAPEVGLPSYVLGAWVGVIAPAGTPAPVVARIHALVDGMLKDPATKKNLDASKLDPAPMSQAQFASFVKTEYAKWGGIVKEAGVEPQ